MRRVGVVTTSRADWGLYLPVLKALTRIPEVETRIIVSGSHLMKRFGRTEEVIGQDGFGIAARVETGLKEDTPQKVATALGRACSGFAACLGKMSPALLLVLGGRWEMFAAVAAALPQTIPVAHIHGGELTLGALDDALRHAMTKMSHLHFAATQEYAGRLAQMGEEPWRITVSGAPGLDNLSGLEHLSRAELEELLGLEFSEPPLVVTFHPATLEHQKAGEQVKNLLAALEDFPRPMVFTMPGADICALSVAREIIAFAQRTPGAVFHTSLGVRGYLSLLARAGAMVGNSSSGIIEAPSFRLPVVNIGSRQEGRVRAANVIDVGYTSVEISEGIARALDPEFGQGLADLVNPYDQGGAGKIIAARLAKVDLGPKLIAKRFVDQPGKGSQA